MAAAMAVSIAFGAFSQDASDYSLLVNMMDGNVVEYEFENCPVATFEGDELVITDDLNEGSLRCNMADIANLTIKKPTVAVSEIEAASHLRIAVSKQAVSVAGLAEGAEVAVFDMSGVKVASAEAGADGVATVAVEQLGAGVFLVSMPGNSFKFVR